MGSTEPTSTTIVDITEQKFKDFRNTLRPLDRKRFDRMFDCIRRHCDTEQIHHAPNRIETMLICTMLEMMGRIEDLEAVTDKEWR